MADFNSAYYPYAKVQTGYSTMRDAGKIPMQIATYLLDLPDANGYVPADDNGRARVRLAKYLWWDTENPLQQSLPTAQEKLSMVFDGAQPDLNTDEQKRQHPKGYRLFPMLVWDRSELSATTAIKIYLGRVIPNSGFEQSIGLIFDIYCSPSYESTMRTDEFSRTYAMECAIIEALHGVNMTGVGVIEFSRYAHGDNGSRYLYNEAGENIGRRLQMSLSWMESGGAAHTSGCGL